MDAANDDVQNNDDAHDGYAPPSASFRRWADLRRSDPRLPFDAAQVAKALEKEKLKEGVLSAPLQKQSRRGRPVLRMENSLLPLMPFIQECRPHWFDDLLWGAIATSAGARRGRLNVRPGGVLNALYLKEITADALMHNDVSKRSAQAIAQSARQTIRAVEHYFWRHPQVKANLESLARAEGVMIGNSAG